LKIPAASCRESSTVRNAVFFRIRSLTPTQAAGNTLAFAVQACDPIGIQKRKSASPAQTGSDHRVQDVAQDFILSLQGFQIGKRKLPTMPFFPDGAVLQSFTVERARRGRCTRIREVCFLEIQYPCHNDWKNNLMNIQIVMLLRPNSSSGRAPIFVILLSEKCHSANPAIELTHSRCYRKGRFKPVLRRKAVDRGGAVLIILVCVHVTPDQEIK
jgi:hypothetical protein